MARYQQQHVHLHGRKDFWRRKSFVVCAFILCSFALLLILGFTVLKTDYKTTGAHDSYLDDVPDELYQKVLKKWYNFDEGKKWYNSENVSILNSTFLNDVRRDWLVFDYNANMSYNLYKPEVRDTSMGQAQRIMEILENKTKGFFIECGAYDGETRSNTLVLERFLDWSGILIEADPINFTKMLQKNRRAYLSPTCISTTTFPMIASFLMARNIGRLHEPANSTEKLPENTLDVAYHGTHIKVQCLPLAAYIAALNVTTVDYFSLDIEGNEIDILETIPFHILDIKTLSVEYIHNKKGRQYMIDLMEKNGYYVHSTVEHPDNLANDIIFVKRDNS